MLEKGSIERELTKSFKNIEKTWNKLLKPAVSEAKQCFGMALGAESKNTRLDKLQQKL